MVFFSSFFSFIHATNISIYFLQAKALVSTQDWRSLGPAFIKKNHYCKQVRCNDMLLRKMWKQTIVFKHTSDVVKVKCGAFDITKYMSPAKLPGPFISP